MSMVSIVIKSVFFVHPLIQQWNFVAERAQASECCEIGRCFDGRKPSVFDIRVSVNGFKKVHGHIATG